MNDTVLSVFFGLAFGFLFGVGLTLAIAQLIYRRGYKKAVADSLEPSKPKLFRQELEMLKQRRAIASAARTAEERQLGEYVEEDEQLRLPPPRE
jgi:hypothetical protein